MLNQLNPRTGQIHLGVLGKLQLPTAATLTIVITGLPLTMVAVQQQLNRTMRQGIERTLGTAKTEISADWRTLKSDIDRSLTDMSAASSTELSESTTHALKQQKTRIEYDWEAMKMESGESIALLMARVVQNSIFSKDFILLNSYVNATLQNPNVIYAFYFRPNGLLLTRFIDQENKKIQT
jgi:hypothetical protein